MLTAIHILPKILWKWPKNFLLLGMCHWSSGYVAEHVRTPAWPLMDEAMDEEGICQSHALMGLSWVPFEC